MNWNSIAYCCYRMLHTQTNKLCTENNFNWHWSINNCCRDTPIFLMINCTVLNSNYNIPNAVIMSISHCSKPFKHHNCRQLVLHTVLHLPRQYFWIIIRYFVYWLDNVQLAYVVLRPGSGHIKLYEAIHRHTTL